MKRFLGLTVKFLIPVIILVTVLEILFSGIPNTYQFKKQLLDEHIHEYEILILGPSLTQKGDWRTSETRNMGNNCAKS